ncbi:MAG TPA: peptidylprolyl isomerase [Rubrivivax sp.]|nr:peptidylprolyl isomerase [Rubrivivax sp.]
MKPKTPVARAALILAVAALALPLAAVAQNIAIVNGKAVPKARVDILLQEAARAGQPIAPEMEAQARDQVVLREIFVQEAEERGIAASPEFKSRMQLARDSVLIRELFEGYRKKNPVTDAEAQVEYDKFKAQASGTEYRARHILVEGEDEARSLTAQIKGGASFEELAKKHSKDPGSGQNGGDLDFAKADSYVPEFGNALAKLEKGQMTDEPVKSQFGWHIIRLEETREAPFPAFEEVKPQLMQRMEQVKMQQYQEGLRDKAKTDYTFSQP